MDLPRHYRYAKDHEWLMVESSDQGKCRVKVGITAYAQDQLGELVYVELPKINKVVERAATLCVVESTKAASDVYAPVTGTVVEVNERLNAHPDLVNKDPYLDGWIVVLDGVALAEVEELMEAPAYQALLG